MGVRAGLGVGKGLGVNTGLGASAGLGMSTGLGVSTRRGIRTGSGSGLLLEVVGGQGGNVGMCPISGVTLHASLTPYVQKLLEFSVLALPVGDGELLVSPGCPFFQTLYFPGIQPGESGIMVQELSQISLGSGSSSPG